jgi:hypothetical protein
MLEQGEDDAFGSSGDATGSAAGQLRDAEHDVERRQATLRWAVITDLPDRRPSDVTW